MTNKLSYFVLLKNAFANLVRGSFSALIAVILPLFLIRILPTETFSVWVIILQLTAYVAYFDFGVQTAVGRFVAYRNDLGDFEQRDRIINTSLAILAGSGLFALLFLCLLTWQLPHIFPKIPSKLLADAKIAILVVGSSLAFGLPFSVFNGIFIGIQRYEIPSVITGVSKLTTALLILIAARINGNLILMSIAIAVVNFVSYGIQLLACRKFQKNIKYHYNLVSKETAKEVFSYCFTLSIWSFGMLLVSGLDITIVGVFEFEAVAYYSIAISIINLIIGLQSAIFNALLPMAAVMDARNEGKQLGKLLISSTRYGMFLLLATGIPLMIGANPLLTLWIGKEFSQGAIVLQCLVIANIIRLSCLPYSTILVSTAQQNLAIISPLIEGFSNLVASLVLGSNIGSIGVAIGTIIGAIVSATGHIFYNMPRTKKIIFSQFKFIQDGLIRPLLCGLPVLLAMPVMVFMSSSFNGVILITALILTLVLIWNLGLLMSERNHVILVFISIFKRIIKTFY